MEIDPHLLKYTREKENKSQRDIAAAVGITQRQICAWEQGIERVHPKHFKKLEAALGVPLHTIAKNELRDDIVDELVERGIATYTQANNAYDAAIGPMIAERMAKYNADPAAHDAILQQIIDAWPKLNADAKLKMITIIAEIAKR